MPLSRKTLGLIAAAAALAATVPLVAQQTPPLGTRDAAKVTAGTYTVDHEHTLVRWKVDHLGITPYFGLFGQITGSLTLDPKNPNAAKVDVTIPVAKVLTASPGLTAHLLRAPAQAGGKPDFFGPAPADAKFVSTRVVLDDDGDEATVTGNLTLNGVTKPVTLDVDFHGAGTNPMNKKDTIGFEAEAKIRRSDFGVAAFIPFVSDEVELKIHAAFEKQ